MGFLSNALSNGRLEIAGITTDEMFRAVIQAAADVRFSVHNADRPSGFVLMRANSDYKHWDGNLSVTITPISGGAAATIAGAVEGFSIIGTKTASRGDLAWAQGRMDTAIRNAAQDIIAARKPNLRRPTGPQPLSQPASRSLVGDPQRDQIAAELNDIRSMLKDGTLSREEFEVAKRRILGLR